MNSVTTKCEEDEKLVEEESLEVQEEGVQTDNLVEVKSEYFITINHRIWLSGWTAITLLAGLNHMLARQSESDIRWFTMNKDTTFDHMKIIYYPWSIYWVCCKLYMININKPLNMLATSLGLLLTICLIAIFYHFYKHLLGLEDSIIADMCFGALSVALGCAYTVHFRKEPTSRWFSGFTSCMTYFGVLIYFTTCSYIDCSDVYQEVYVDGSVLNNLMG